MYIWYHCTHNTTGWPLLKKINIITFVVVLVDAMYNPLICLLSAWLIWSVHTKTPRRTQNSLNFVTKYYPCQCPNLDTMLSPTRQLITTYFLHVRPLLRSRGTVPTLLVGRHVMTCQLFCLLTWSLLPYSCSTDSIPWDKVSKLYDMQLVALNLFYASDRSVATTFHYIHSCSSTSPS